MGDLAILRPCAPTVAAGGPPAPGVPPVAGGPPLPGEPGVPSEPIPPLEGGPGFGDLLVEMWPDWPPPPPPICPLGAHLTQGQQCCPAGQIPGVNGACQSACSNGDLNPAHMEACYHGYQPGLHPAGLSAGTCWNGAAPVKAAGCGPLPNNLACNKCPRSPLKRCPSGTIEQAIVGPPAVGDEWSDVRCVPGGPPAVACPIAGQTAYPVNRCCLNGTAPDALGQCNPGIVVPPQWYLDFLASGTGPCLLPDGNCSYYEFTIIGRQRFGRGSLTERITLPSGSVFPEARVVRGSKYCPASAWSCSKSGDVLTCSAEDCGLAPGDQVVTRLEGRVVPEMTAPPATPIEKTACGVLEWQAVSGPGRLTAAVPGEAPGPSGRPAASGVDVGRRLATTTKPACWTIRVVGRTPAAPACPPNYVSTANGQCCLRAQMTTTGVCCPAGQTPDAHRRTCIAKTPRAPIVVPGIIQARPPERYCAPGSHWDGRRCVPDIEERVCPSGQHRVGKRCVPDIEERGCPSGQHLVGKRCVPDVEERVCPSGQHLVGKRCVPDIQERICPPGQHRAGKRCVPDIQEISCPPGHHRVGRHCVPSRLEFRRPPPSRGTRPPPPQRQFKRPMQQRSGSPGPY